MIESPRYFRPSMEFTRASFAGAQRNLGWASKRQSPIYQCSFLDFKDRGGPWRDLAPDYGSWSNTHRRFIRWRDKGIWEKLLEQLVEDPDYEWLMIDASHIKVHPHAAGAKGGNQEMSRSSLIQRYIWMRMVCRSESLLQTVPRLIARKLRS
jgi:hypothetical protein